VLHAVLAVLWLVVCAQFWRWWIPRAADGDAWLAIGVSVALAYQTFVLPSVFWLYVGRMRRPVPRPAPDGLSVALVSPCVPSCESLEVIEAQLRAMAAVEHPHESWLLDEEDVPEVRALCERYGVRHFSRAGVARWNQPGPPHQRATKAGNVNAWLAHVDELGIAPDVFVQLDVDHHPVPGYLGEVLGHLDDPQVAWVQAPSVVGNLETWTARGLAEQDLVLQGPLQMGFYGATGTPFIIGSHTTYRTSAIREIGGFQPTRAEDHLDTVVLAAHGHRGVFVPQVIATGDGPDDLATYLRQQFAWAHSMITVFLTWTPRLLWRYTPGQALQFLFAQSWYVLWSLSLLVLWAAPQLAMVTGSRIADAPLSTYLLYALPPALVAWTMWLCARPVFQPAGVQISWRGCVLTVARWPVVLWALASVLLRIKRPYMITPKRGPGEALAPKARASMVFGPLVALAALALAAAWVPELLGGGDAGQGYVGLVLLNALVPTGALAVVLGLELRDRRRATGRLWHTLAGRAGTLLALALLAGGLAVTAVHAWPALQAVLA
jgi:cellulose synthase/poly-beta-1,6-N-acetylglucosamine synthase-like glycosyltransferase